ncbi:MAG: acyl-CoA thioesterase II [Pseudomonadota bacterium]
MTEAASAQLSELIDLLDLEQVEQNLFRAVHPKDRERRLYGGQIMAQALMAASRTVEDRLVHSLHGYFLRPGSPTTPAIIQVERLRDGGSFSARRVVVVQRGEAIFNMDVSFQVPELGLEHQVENPRPDVLPPVPEKIPDYLHESAFITWRHEFRRLQEQAPQPPEQFVWFKANGKVPADATLRACLLVYESDNTLISTARLPHRGNFDREAMQVASLDHAMWFHHHPVPVDSWLMYAQDSPSTSGGRGMSRGSIYTEAGLLIASTVQEGLIRVHKP